MHRLILGISGRTLGDHEDGDSLNNQRYNLRPATYQDNGANRKKRAPGLSRFKGVRPSLKKWRGLVRSNGQIIPLGTFETEIEAALAYDRKARELFGEFARCNFPVDFGPFVC